MADDLPYRRLGRTGLQVSAICLGTMQFGWTAGEETAFAVLDAAVDAGCNFVDSADLYSRWVEGHQGGESETIIGRWLARRPGRRRQLVLATKVRAPMGDGPNDQGLTRLHLVNGVEESLRRLQTDTIDLYQMHWPDEDTPLDETLRALDDLVRAGKIRYIGCSNYPAWLLAKALWRSDVGRLVRFEALQPHYNYVHRAEFERELQPLCLDQQIGVLPYSPLAGGFLSGKYRRDAPLPDSARAGSVQRRYMNARGFAAVEALAEMAAARGVSVPQLAMAWVLANPAVTAAIAGANSVAQLAENMGGAALVLSTEEKTRLDAVTAWES